MGMTLWHAPSTPTQQQLKYISCSKLALQIRVKKDFQTLFEILGLTLQLSDVLCPFQMYYHNMNTNTVDG